MRGKKIIAAAAGVAAVGLPFAAGMAIREATAATVNHEIRVVSGVPGTRSNVTPRTDCNDPFNWHGYLCGENALDLTNPNGSAGLGAFFSVQQTLAPGAPLIGRVRKYGISSTCPGVFVDIKDPSSGVLLGSTLYVHIEKTAGQMDPPPVDYDIPIDGGNGAWTVAQLGLIYGANNPSGCPWTGPHLHQGGQFQSGHGVRNNAICSAWDGCYIDPTNDTVNKWIHKYTWSTIAPDPTPTPVPSGGGGGGK
jgi:hypothetical protein